MWDRWISASADDVARVLSSGLPGTTRGSLKLEEDGKGRLSWYADWLEAETALSSLQLGEKRGGTDLVYLKPGCTGAQLGRTMVRNEVDFMARLGVRQFHIIAAGSLGAAAWPLLGYRPVIDDNFEESVQEASRRLDLLSDLAPETAQIADAALAVLNPRDADCTARLAEEGGDLRPAMRLKPVREAMQEILEDAGKSQTMTKIQHRFASGDQRISISSFALGGTILSAVLDLDDPALAARFTRRTSLDFARLPDWRPR